MSTLRLLQVMSTATVALLVSGAGLLTAAQAQETCGEASTGLCFGRYSGITAVAPSGSGYAAMATMRDQLDLLRLDAGGQITSDVQLRGPDWLSPEAVAPTINALASRPDGGVLAIGWAMQEIPGKIRQVGAIAMITADGTPRWLDPIDIDDKSSVILHSAVYDTSADRFVIVGRATSGGDNGTCKEWAQAIAFSVPANPERDVVRKSIARFGSTGKGPGNRIALLDVVAGQNAWEFIAVGFATSANQKKDGCQDDAIAMRIQEMNGSWRLGKPYVLAKSTESEVANAVVATGNGRYVFAGSAARSGSKAKATLTGSFGLSDAALTSQLVPIPDDSDTSGGDRYRVLAALKPRGSFLAAGSASAGKEGRNQGIWTALAVDGTAKGETRYLSRDGGSDILDLAVGSNGRVLAVGTQGSGDAKVGWVGMLTDRQDAAPVARRLPDTSLPLVETGTPVAFSDADIVSGTGRRHKSTSAGQSVAMRIVLSKAMDVAVSALASKGDLDLSLSGADDRLVAQSNNVGDAGEYLSARLPAGEYQLSAVAISDLGEYEIRLSQQNLEAGIWSLLLQLDTDARYGFAAGLEAAGYGSAANPAIALGGDTVRAFLAYCLTFMTSLDPTVVSQLVPQSVADAVP